MTLAACTEECTQLTCGGGPRGGAVEMQGMGIGLDTGGGAIWIPPTTWGKGFISSMLLG